MQCSIDPRIPTARAWPFRYAVHHKYAASHKIDFYQKRSDTFGWTWGGQKLKLSSGSMAGRRAEAATPGGRMEPAAAGPQTVLRDTRLIRNSRMMAPIAALIICPPMFGLLTERQLGSRLLRKPEINMKNAQIGQADNVRSRTDILPEIAENAIKRRRDQFLADDGFRFLDLRFGLVHRGAILVDRLPGGEVILEGALCSD